MKNFKAFLILSAFTVLLVCCTTTSFVPTQDDVTIAQSHWQGTTMDDLKKGYDIYADKCTDCHNMKKPQKFSVDDWTNDYMPTMGRKAKLTHEEYDLVLHYVLARREAILNGKKVTKK